MSLADFTGSASLLTSQRRNTILADKAMEFAS
jgi:hypothetical protein